jgi:hypothetical protein
MPFYGKVKSSSKSLELSIGLVVVA